MRIVRHYKRMRPHKTKRDKSSSDDDESDWVQLAIAAGGLALSLWDRHKQKEANTLMAENAADQKQAGAQAGGAMGTALQGTLEVTEKRAKEQKDFLTADLGTKLKEDMSKIHDSGGSFSGSYRDTAIAENVGQTVWQGYRKDAYSIDTAASDTKAGAYTNTAASAADLKKLQEETEATINALT